MIKILFTCAGRRNYLINYFKELRSAYNIYTLATDVQLIAPAMFDVDEAIIMPSFYSEAYIPKLISICKEKAIDMVIPLNDLELPIIAKYKKEFELVGTKVIISSSEVIDICLDKSRTAVFLQSIGLKTPQTYNSLSKAKEAIKVGKLNFPLVVKPRWGSGSIGIDFPINMVELELSYSLQKHKLDRTILATVSKNDFGNSILIQEKIDGKEYGLDIINDFDGVNYGVIVKEKLAMRAGETDKAVTRNNVEITIIGRKIGDELKHIGNMDCDVLERDGEYYVLELNPRFGGGYPFSHEAGVNIPKAYVQWYMGDRADDSCFDVVYNACFSKCDKLMKITNIDV